MVRLVGVAAVDSIDPKEVFLNPFVLKQTSIIVDHASRYADAAMAQPSKLIVRVDRSDYMPDVNARCSLRLITTTTMQNAISLLDMNYDYDQAVILVDEQWQAELCDELMVLGDHDAEETKVLVNTLGSGLREISAALSLQHFGRPISCTLRDLAQSQSFEHSRRLFYACSEIRWDVTVTLAEIFLKSGSRICVRLNRRANLGRTYFLSGNKPGGPVVNVDLIDLRHKYATLAYLLLKITE